MLEAVRGDVPALVFEILQLDRSLAAKGFDETSREAVLQLAHASIVLDFIGLVLTLDATVLMTSAESSSLEAPCTNRPMQCQHCSLVIASYSMAQHYSTKHSSIPTPRELEDGGAAWQA